MLVFNKGFLCLECGPIEKAASKQINKAKHDVCPACGNIVRKWERPLNERDGRCYNCGHAHFKSAMGKNKLKGHLLRQCRKCNEVYDIDAEKILVKGEKEHAFKTTV